MSERSSEWKLREGVFKQIVSTFGKPDIDLFGSRINHHLSNYIYWRPDLGVKAADAFSINWSPTYNYSPPPWSIILNVLQKIQKDKAQAIVVVPYRTLRSCFPVFLVTLVDHLLIMTASLNMPVSSYPLNDTSPSASQVKASSGSYIWENIESQNLSITAQYILLSSWRKSTWGRYNTVLQQWHDFCGENKPIICYIM